MSEWLWFLLPVAAASGWLAATAKGAGDKTVKTGRDIPPEYLRGLGFLIDQRHDKATDIFIKLFEVDSNTVETHLVLGNLFRQKGEVEKAIRIHQNIIARPRLSDYHRSQALLELGRDYFSAGLLDRAEKFFNHVLSMKVEQVRLEAYFHLVSIYEMEKSWEQAIESAEKLRRRSVSGYNHRVSHYYCELAEQAMQREDYAGARKLLAKAKSSAGASLRVAVLAGDLDLEYGEVAAAERHYVTAFEKHPEYAKFLLPKMRKALTRLGASEFPNYLKKIEPKVASTSYLMAYCEALIDAGRTREVDALFSELIAQRRVPLPVVRLYLEYQARTSVSDKTLITSVIQGLLANERTHHSYQCSNCGFEAHRLYWQCPSCRRWGTAQPRDVVGAAPDDEADGGAAQASAA